MVEYRCSRIILEVYHQPFAKIGILNVVGLLSFAILTNGNYLMPALNQPIFRSNAIRHYMQREEKHTLPRFISLPITIFLWTLLALFLAAGALVWSEQVPTYATTQGIVVVQSAAQPSGKSASVTGGQIPVTGKQIPATEKSAPTIGKQVPATEKPILPISIAVFFFPPAQAQNLHAGVPVRLHVGPSGPQFSSQIIGIEPGVMSPMALRSLFHLENASLPITQPSAVVIVKLNPAFATMYAGSTLTADVQVGSQSLISLLPGVGHLLGK